ncbi:acyl-CoA dehydrogenase family protein [Streptomyces asiaticus]
MAVDRMLPTQEAEDLIDLTRELAEKELGKRVEEHEVDERYPDGLFALLGRAGLLGLPYPEEHGGGGQPYEVYLQVLEELATQWAAVAVATSVHTLACYPLHAFGTSAQQERWLPRMLAGEFLGGYSLSEPQAGSDAAALTCKAERVEDGYRISGTKAWITHGGKADFYALFARTAPGTRGISCFLAPGAAEGLTFGRPERKMGLNAIPTTSAMWDGAVIDLGCDRGRPAAGRHHPAGRRCHRGGTGPTGAGTHRDRRRGTATRCQLRRNHSVGSHTGPRRPAQP